MRKFLVLTAEHPDQKQDLKNILILPDTEPETSSCSAHIANRSATEVIKLYVLFLYV